MLIKDICSSLTDGSHNPPQGISESSFLMLSSKNVFDDNITLDEPRFLSKEDFEKENKRTNIKAGDILLTIVGTVGRSAVVTADLPPFTLQRSVAVLHPNIEVCNERYLMYALQGRRSYIENRAKGVAQKGIYLKEVAGIDIPVPSKDVQNKIVAKLDKVNSIIKYRRMELLKLDELVKARFVEMFGDPFETAKWTIKELKDVSKSMIDGSNVNPNYYELEGEVLFLRIQNVWRNEFRLDDSVYITQEINHKHYYDTSLKKGDLLITKIGRYYTKDSSLGRVSVYRGEDDCANYSNNIMCVRLNDSINSEFVNVLLNLDDYQAYIKHTSKGGTDKRALSKSLIGSYPIIVPPKTLQDEFVSFVEQVDKSKFVVQKALDEAQTLFDSLMQEYFG